MVLQGTRELITEQSCQIQSKRNLYEAVALADQLCMSFNEITLLYMSWLEYRLPRLLFSILSHFPQLSWIRRLIYPGTCARGFISCSVSVLINVRGLLTCLTPDDTLCLLWQNGKVGSVTCFDTGVTGLLGACLCVCCCVTMAALHMFMQLKGRGKGSSTQTVQFLMNSCLRNRSTMNPSSLALISS